MMAGCLAALLFTPRAQAQSPGALDTTFTSITTGSTFYTLTLQPTSTTPILTIGGDFAAFNELIANGTDYTDFVVADFGNESARLIYTIVPELVLNGTSTPKLLVGGLFGRSATQIKDMAPAQNIVRTLANGDLDPTFNPGKGADNYVTAILPLADGGMVVGGVFTLFNTQNHEHIVRLDKTGAIVSSSVFSTTLAFDDTVLSLAAQVNPNTAGPQGQILAAGIFGNVNGLPHHSLARINADGTLDASFNPNFGDRVRVVVSQPDGKILAGGDFETVNGVAVKHLVRLNYDGSIDPTFNALVTTQPPLIAAPVAVNAITPLGDGRYYIGGNFAKINGVTRNYLGRVLADGTVDDFDPGTAITNAVQQVAVDATTNRVYVAETRSKSLPSSMTKYPPSLIRLFGDPLPIPKVSVTGSQVSGTHGPYGRFSFIRTKTNITQPLNAYVTLGGTGTLQTSSSGSGDYTFSPALTNTTAINGEPTYLITFPAYTATVVVKARATASLTGSRTVELTLQPDPSSTNPYTEIYTVGKRPSATVTVTP